MSSNSTPSWATLLFSGFSILSALPLLGLPFPTRRAALYYAGKNAWLATLLPFNASPTQAGYLAAVVRIAFGLGLLVPTYRPWSLATMTGIVGVGTGVAWRDGRPMTPQWGMLGALGVVWVMG